MDRMTSPSSYQCIRLRLHEDDQSGKNGGMYSGVAFSCEHAHEEAKNTLFFFDRCCCRARASMYYQKCASVVWCLHVRFSCLRFPSLHFKSPFSGEFSDIECV